MTDIHARLAGRNTALKMAHGIGSGGVNRVSIKNSAFRLISAEGEIIDVQERYLDVILLDANEHISKAYYATAYTGEEGKAPDCFSHNGYGPSASCSQPQAERCAICPHNQWGTGKKADGSPSKGKACADRKLVAILAVKYAGKTYKLDVPPTSLQNLGAHVKNIARFAHPTGGRPLEPFDVVTRVTFDAGASGQVLLFDAKFTTPDGRADASKLMGDQHLKFIADLLDSDQTAALIEKNDKPHQGGLAKPDNRTQVSPPARNVPTQAQIAAPDARDRMAAAKAQVAQGRAEATKAPVAPVQTFTAPASPPAGLDAMLGAAGFDLGTDEFDSAMNFQA